MTDMINSGRAIKIKEAGGWTRTVSFAVNEDAALAAYTTIHIKVPKDAAGGAGDAAAPEELKTLLQEQGEELAEMRNKYDETAECLEQVAESQMGLDRKLNQQAKGLSGINEKIEEHRVQVIGRSDPPTQSGEPTQSCLSASEIRRSCDIDTADCGGGHAALRRGLAALRQAGGLPHCVQRRACRTAA